MDGKNSDCFNGNQAGNVVNSDAEQSANGLDDLTPEQLVILHEKMELEKLLEVTKKLQQQANLFFSTKETSSPPPPPSASREQKKRNALESSEERRDASGLQSSSNNYDFSQITELNRSTVTLSEPPKRDADKTEKTESVTVPSTKQVATVCDNPDSDGSKDPLSLLGNARLLEENAALLQKKIELEVLLHRASILLEHTGLLEATGNAAPGGDEFSVEENVETIARVQSTLDSNVDDGNSGKVNNNNNAEECGENKLETFYETVSELTSGTKSLSDFVHQNTVPCCKKIPKESTNSSTLNSDEDLKQASHGAPTCDVSDRFSESETRPDIDEFQKEHVEITDNNNQTELYDKHTIQRLLQKADLLLEQANRTRRPQAENASKEVNSGDLQGLSVRQDLKEATSTEENGGNRQTLNGDVVGVLATDHTNTEAAVLLHATANEESIADRLGQEFSKGLDQTTDDDDDDDDDDPSFDAKFHLQQLLLRAKTVLERSKLPARERLLEHEAAGLDGSRPTEETPKLLASSSDLCASKTDSKSDALDVKLPENNYETGSLEKLSASAQATGVSETDFDSLTQDAQLEFLIRTTSTLKQKADLLINQISEPENPSGRPTTLALGNHEGATTNDRIPTENTTNAKQEYPITTQLDRAADTAIGEKLRSGLFETAEFRQDTEGCQMEYEEVEESQLQINENDKSPLEIEDDEYASIDSDMCDMMQYYDDTESSSSAEEETDFSETQTDGIEAKLRQLQKVSGLLVVNSEFASETFDSRQPLDISTSENQHLRPSGRHNEQENLAYQLQQAPGAFNYSAPFETEFLSRTGDASQAPTDKDGTVGGDLANDDDGGDAFDERAELRLLLEKTKQLLHEKAKQPLDVEKKESETVVNICPGDVNSPKQTDSTANEDSALKSDEISKIPASTNQDNSTVDTDTKTFDHAEVNQPQSCHISPENAAEEDTLMSEKQSPCEELQVVCPALRPESDEFADETVLCSVKKEQETSPHDVDEQDMLSSVANSSELLSTQLTQIRAEINTILREASTELTDPLEAETDLDSSSNCSNAAKQPPRRNDRPSEEQPKIPDTLCSGHSISQDVEVATDQRRVRETEAEPTHTGTGVPKTDGKTNGAKTGQDCSGGNEPKNLNSLSSLTKLLNLQKDMARMQLHLSNLQDSMRTASATLQELLDEAFSEL